MTFNKKRFDAQAPQLFCLAALSQVGGWLSETDMTEHIFGSSGRGSPRAKKILRNMAALGIIYLRQNGRVRHYHVPAALVVAAKEHPQWGEGEQQHLELELKFLHDGTRPFPRGGVL